MRKAFKRASITALVLVLISLLGAVLFAKDLVELAASWALGREVAIAGEFNIDLSRVPTIHAGQVSIANADWAEQPHMVEIGALTLSIDLEALLGGQLVLPEVRLSEPVLSLAKSAEGEVNWSFAANSDPPQEAKSPGRMMPVVRHLSADNGRVVYRDLAQNTELSVFFDALESRTSSAQPIHLSAHGRIESEPFTLKASLSTSGDTWSLTDFAARIGKSSLRGNVTVEWSGARPLVQAYVRSSTLDVGALVALFDRPEAGGKKLVARRKPFDLPLNKLNTVNARVHFHGEQIIGTRLPLGELTINAALQDGRLTVAPFELKVAQGVLAANLVVDASNPTVTGKIGARFDAVPLTPLFELFGRRQAPDALLNGKLTLAFSGDELGVADGRIVYHAPKKNTNLVFKLERERRVQEWLLSLHGSGTFRGAAARLHFTGRPLALLSAPHAVVPVALELSLAANHARLKGTMRGWGEALDLHTEMSGPGTRKLSELIGIKLPQLPRYRGSGHLITEENSIRVEALQATIGASDVSGSVLVRTKDEKPFVEADLTSDTIAYADFDALLSKDQKPFEWNRLRRFEGDIEVAVRRMLLPDALALSRLRLDASLVNGVLELRPLRFEVAGGKVEIDLALSADPRKSLQGTVRADVEHVDLGNALKPFGLGARFPGLLDARLNWSLGVGNLPAGDSTLHYRERKSGNDVRLVVSQAPSYTQVTSEGRFHNEPFRLRGTLGPLSQLLRPAPYPVDLQLQLLETRARIHGTLREPLQLQGVSAALEISGSNPQRLAEIFGFNLPDLPPYRVQGHLARYATTWSFTDFAATVADSDFSGRISVDTAGKQPYIKGEIRSRLLDLEAFAGVTAAPRPGRVDPASAKQQRRTAREQHRSRARSPDAIGFSWLSRFNADMHYRAARVESARLPIDSMTLDFALQNGRLTLKPLQVGVAGGTLSANVSIDGNRQPAAGTVELEAKQIKLSRIIRKVDLARGSEGVIDGRATLWVSGNSIAKMLASADGGAFLLLSGGELNALLVELAGLDGGEAFVTWMTPGTQTVDVRCAYIDLQARNGIIDVATGVIDTADTKFTLDGTINLPDETLRLVIDPHPKDFSLLSLQARLVVEGPFKALGVHPSLGGLIARGAAAVALGAVAPPLALLALVELGLGQNAPCRVFQDTFEKLQ